MCSITANTHLCSTNMKVNFTSDDPLNTMSPSLTCVWYQVPILECLCLKVKNNQNDSGACQDWLFKAVKVIFLCAGSVRGPCVSFKWIPCCCWLWSGKCTVSYLIEKLMAIYHSLALIGFLCPWCSKLNVSFLLQPKRCECGNQLHSAPVRMGRENIKLNMHTTFHWQLMFITTSRKKNCQVALRIICNFIGELMPGCVEVFCIIKCPWMGSYTKNWPNE